MSQTLAYLLDTDTCIYLLNGNPVVKRHVASVGVQAIAVSALSVAELCFGARYSAKPDTNLERICAFLDPPGPEVLPFDTECAEWFGRFKADLRRAGQPIGDMDLLIASVAASRDLALVTNNADHFGRIEEIRLANWLDPLARTS